VTVLGMSRQDQNSVQMASDLVRSIARWFSRVEGGLASLLARSSLR
jgi:hypothetical protein